MEIVSSILSFLTEILKSEGAFVFFAFLVLIIQSIAIWALYVSNINKSIISKRKELGMNEVDQCVSNVFKILNSHYLTLAKERFGVDYFNKKDTAIYRYLIQAALDEKKPTYRSRIRTNHFDEKKPAEWQRYVQDCITDDLNSVTYYLDQHYHPQSEITRPEIFEWNKSKMDEIKKDLEYLFSQLLQISENNKLKKFFKIKLELGSIK